MAWHKRKKLYLLLLGLILVIIFLFCFIITIGVNRVNGINRINQKVEYKNIEIKGYNIKAEVTSDSWRQHQGLSNRDSLCADCGMLFIFPDKQIRKFVMRNMKFPLDIIFILDNKIINIAENLAPEGASPINIYASTVPVNNVLEITAGYAQKNGIKVGDTVNIK